VCIANKVRVAFTWRWGFSTGVQIGQRAASADGRIHRKTEFYNVTSNGESVCMTVYVSCTIPISDTRRRSFQVAAVDKAGEPLNSARGTGAVSPEGSKMALVYFDSTSAELTAESKRKLRALLNDMKVLGLRHIYLRGHTDTLGSREYNMQLSADRARNVHDWLEQRALNADFTSETPRGEAMPAVLEDLKPGDARNRRVEVFVD
jgi:outer membrane protein OmpA-like peptidoglycan-associated protein